MKKYAYYYETKIGNFFIEEDGIGITQITINEDEHKTDVMLKETELLREMANQLYEYLNGERKVFSVKLNLEGTEFQKSVWETLLTIPYGETWSYKKVAEAIGNPKAARAVGMANNKNPVMIVIPCHRVIGANGKLVGYSEGLSVKKFLLDLEKEEVLYE